MNAADWIYAGEGGAHVIFSCQRRVNNPPHAGDGDDGDNQSALTVFNQHDLLRIAKQDIIDCTTQQHIHDTDDGIFKVSSSSDDTSSMWYLVHIVAPALHPFVNVPQPVHIHPRLATALCRHALDSGKIPSRRMNSWKIDKQSSTTPTEEHPVSTPQKMVWGVLLRDYRLPRSNNVLSCTERTVLSVEIKPKAGYTAISPLVNPDRRAKYRQCRYQLVHGAETCYNPLDLFSREPNRIRRALQALVQHPRNNFRMWLAKTSTSNNDIEIVQGNLPGDEDANCFVQQWISGTTVDILIDILTHILHQEDDFLARIKVLQSLDVIDSDGAVRIYDHLIQDWLDGSHERVWELLDVIRAEKNSSAQTHNRNSCNIVHQNRLLASCPPALLADLGLPSSILHDYLATVERLETILLTEADEHDESAIDELHQQALRLVKQMNRQDCVILLRLWLLSLAMCDLSFFVRLEVGLPSDQNEEDLIIQQDNKQSSKGLGLVVHLIQGCEVKISYEINVIDCDRKPAKKLKSRREKEDDVFSNSSASVGALF